MINEINGKKYFYWHEWSSNTLCDFEYHVQSLDITNERTTQQISQKYFSVTFHILFLKNLKSWLKVSGRRFPIHMCRNLSTPFNVKKMYVFPVVCKTTATLNDG